MHQAFVRRSAAAALLVALSSPSLAAPQSGSASDNRMICKFDRGTSSRIANVRRCKTAADWEIERKRQEELQSERDEYLLRAPQDSTGTRGATAGDRGGTTVAPR